MNDRTLLWLVVGLAVLAVAATGTVALMSTNWMQAAQASGYLPLLQAAETKYGIPSGLLVRLAYQESRFRLDVISGATVSSSGAQGIMQLMPQYYPGVDPLDPAQAIDAAAASLANYYSEFGTWTLALAAYNAGPGNVKKYGDTVPPFQETQDYVSQILGDVNAAGGQVA
jgi:soluble lytic murein transglycosylase-like protein